MAHPVDALLQVFVGIDAQALGKIIIGLDIRKTVCFAEFCVLRLFDQFPQDLALDSFPLFLLPRECALPGNKGQSGDFGQTHGVQENKVNI